MRISAASLIVLLLLHTAPAETTDTVTLVRDGEVPGVTTVAVARLFQGKLGEDVGEAAAAKLTDHDSQLRVSVWRSLGATLLVIGLLLAANYWVRRRGSGFVAVGRSQRLRIADRVPVDPRRAILLLEADGARIVVAVGIDRIETLAVLSLNDGKLEEEV